MQSPTEAQKDISIKLGFSFAWPVYQRYVIKGDVLCEVGRHPLFLPTRLIAPAIESDLYATLAKVHQGIVKPLEFASQFGLLGHDHTVDPTARRGGDPIPWFRRQANDVFHIVNLLEAISDTDALRVQQWLKGLRPPYFHASVHWESNPVRAGREFLSRLLTARMEGIHRKLEVAADGTMRSVFQPRALIDVIYWQLADYACGNGRVRHCVGCGEIFVSSDPRRLYCPGKTCANRTWVRRFRERQKKRRRRK